MQFLFGVLPISWVSYSESICLKAPSMEVQLVELSKSGYGADDVAKRTASTFLEKALRNESAVSSLEVGSELLFLSFPRTLGIVLHNFLGLPWLSLTLVPQNKFCFIAYSWCVAWTWLIQRTRSSGKWDPRYFLSETRDFRFDAAHSESNQGVNGWYLFRTERRGACRSSRSHKVLSYISCKSSTDIYTNIFICRQTELAKHQIISKFISIKTFPCSCGYISVLQWWTFDWDWETNQGMIRFFCFFFTIFVSSHMYPENPEGTQVIVGSMNMGYISDTARNRTHNLFRPKREPIPL